MFRVSLVVFAFFVSLVIPQAEAMTITPVWSERLGGGGWDGSGGSTIDSSDNLILVGSVVGDGDLNGDGDELDSYEVATGIHGARDIFISIFNSAGAHQWSKRLGGVSNDKGPQAITDSADNIIVTGYVDGDADLDGNGTTTDAYETAHVIFASADGFISVFNSAGVHQWSKRLGGLGSESIRSVTVDSADNIIVTGYVDGDADLDGNGTTTDAYESQAASFSDKDAFISVFNSAGVHQWSKRLGGAGFISASSVTVQSNDDIVVAGNTNGDADLDGNGTTTDAHETASGIHSSNDVFISVFYTPNSSQFYCGVHENCIITKWQNM